MANIRSEYIKNFMEEKEDLEKRLDEATKETISNILGEKVNEGLRNIISEDKDEYEVEEVGTDDANSTDANTTEEPGATDTEGDTSSDGDNADAAAETGDDAATATDAAGEGSGDEAGDVWGGLDNLKGEDGNYDLTGMDTDNVIKVLKVMDPDKDGVIVVDNGDDTLTLTDNENDKEYIIDLSGKAGNSDNKETPEASADETDFSIDLENESVENECGGEAPVTEGNVNLGYTDNYQKDTAMTTPDNHEPADSKSTYSMDGGVPTGTEKPFANDGDKQPYNQKVNEGEACEKCGKTPCECEKEVNETMTTQEEGPYNRGDGMVHTNNNDKAAKGRNSHANGKQVHGTGENSYSAAQVENIKRMANAIFNENKELKKFARGILTKLNEQRVITASLGKIVKIVVENSTTREEKTNIIERFNNVKTVAEGDRLYETVCKELQSSHHINSVDRSIDNQLAESKKTNLVETAMYTCDDLSDTIDFMERLNKIK